MPEYAGAYFFLSAEITGNGSAQNTAHTLHKVPERVLPVITGGPASYTQPAVTLGAHTADNLIATVTTGWKYRLLALA